MPKDISLLKSKVIRQNDVNEGCKTQDGKKIFLTKRQKYFTISKKYFTLFIML